MLIQEKLPAKAAFCCLASFWWIENLRLTFFFCRGWILFFKNQECSVWYFPVDAWGGCQERSPLSEILPYQLLHLVKLFVPLRHYFTCSLCKADNVWIILLVYIRKSGHKLFCFFMKNAQSLTLPFFKSDLWNQWLVSTSMPTDCFCESAWNGRV